MVIVVRLQAAASSAFWTMRSLAVSSAEVASSSKRIRGLLMRARAIAK